MPHIPTPWPIGPDSLGPLTADTLFSLDALAPLLPGYALTETPSPDGPAFRQIEAIAPGDRDPGLIFLGHVDQATITGVRIRETRRVPNAWIIGSTMAQTLIKPQDCFTAQDVPGREGDVYWREPGHLRAPTYWFRTGLDTTGGILPDADTLANSLLYEISWVAWQTG